MEVQFRQKHCAGKLGHCAGEFGNVVFLGSSGAPCEGMGTGSGAAHDETRLRRCYANLAIGWTHSVRTVVLAREMFLYLESTKLVRTCRSPENQTQQLP